MDRAQRNCRALVIGNRPAHLCRLAFVAAAMALFELSAAPARAGIVAFGAGEDRVLFVVLFGQVLHDIGGGLAAEGHSHLQSLQDLKVFLARLFKNSFYLFGVS